MILKLLGVAILCAACAFLLRGLAWRAAPIFACLAAILLLALCEGAIGEITSSLSGIAVRGDVTEPVSVIIKIIGLGYLFGISSDVCRELGESGIAKALEVGGRVEIILISMPYLIKTLNLGIGLISG